MTEITFKTVDELESYLEENDMKETLFFTTPDYVTAIIGVANNGKLVYSYENMVESLYEQYMEDDTIDDPYTAAIEWIDFNADCYMGPMTPIQVMEIPMEGYDLFYECDGIEDELNEYANCIIGIDKNMRLVINTDKIDGDESVFDKLDELEEKHKDNGLSFIYV